MTLKWEIRSKVRTMRKSDFEMPDDLTPVPTEKQGPSVAWTPLGTATFSILLAWLSFAMYLANSFAVRQFLSENIRLITKFILGKSG